MSIKLLMQWCKIKDKGKNEPWGQWTAAKQDFCGMKQNINRIIASAPLPTISSGFE